MRPASALAWHVRQQAGDRHLGKGRIGDMRVAFAVGELRCFELQMQAISAQRIAAGLLGAVGLQDIQHEQGGEALARRRAFPQRVPL